MRMANRLTVTTLLFTLTTLTGCEGKLESMSDEDLQDKVYECNRQASQSPGFAISCDNYRRECARRRDEGRFVC